MDEMKKQTTIKIANEFTKDKAYKKAAKLGSMTLTSYYQFTYHVCPAGGSFDIMLSSPYEFESEDAEKEMLQAFNFILVSNM